MSYDGLQERHFPATFRTKLGVDDDGTRHVIVDGLIGGEWQQVARLGSVETDKFLTNESMGGYRYKHHNHKQASGVATEYFMLRMSTGGNGTATICGNYDTDGANYLAAGPDGYRIVHKTTIDTVDEVGDKAGDYEEVTEFTAVFTLQDSAILETIDVECAEAMTDVAFNTTVVSNDLAIVHSKHQTQMTYDVLPEEEQRFKRDMVVGTNTLLFPQGYPLGSGETCTLKYQFSRPVKLRMNSDGTVGGTVRGKKLVLEQVATQEWVAENTNKKFFDGECEQFSHLPTVASDHDGEVFLVHDKQGTRVLGNYKPAGLYESRNSVWDYLGADIQQVTSAEKVAGTSTAIKRFSPRDVADVAANTTPKAHTHNYAPKLGSTLNNFYAKNVIVEGKVDGRNIAEDGAVLDALPTNYAAKDHSHAAVEHDHNKLENEVVFVQDPIGGTFRRNSSSTGVIRIELPSDTGSFMVTFAVDIYEHRTDSAKTVFISGYGYGRKWSSVTARTITSNPNDDMLVRFGNGPNQVNYVYIGEEDTSHSYLHVKVRDVSVSNASLAVDTWKDDWKVTLQTSVVGICATVTAGVPVADFDKLLNKPSLDFAPKNGSTSNAFTASHLHCAGNLYHQGDVDTLLEFTNDNIGVVTGGGVRARFTNNGFNLLRGAVVDEFSTSVSLGSANNKVPTQAAVKGYADKYLAPKTGSTSKHFQASDLYVAAHIYHAGDTDTYLQFSTDTLKIATGGTNRASINNSGLVLQYGQRINEFDAAFTGTGVDSKVPTTKAVVDYTTSRLASYETTTQAAAKYAPITGSAKYANITGNIAHSFKADSLFVDNKIANNSNRTWIDVHDYDIGFTCNLLEVVTLNTEGLKLKSGSRIAEFSTDADLSGDSNTRVPTEKAVKTYVDNNAAKRGGHISEITMTKSLHYSEIDHRTNNYDFAAVNAYSLKAYLKRYGHVYANKKQTTSIEERVYIDEYLEIGTVGYGYLTVGRGTDSVNRNFKFTAQGKTFGWVDLEQVNSSLKYVPLGSIGGATTNHNTDFQSSQVSAARFAYYGNQPVIIYASNDDVRAYYRITVCHGDKTRMNVLVERLR